jgi:hypothetical protein
MKTNDKQPKKISSTKATDILAVKANVRAGIAKPPAFCRTCGALSAS